MKVINNTTWNTTDLKAILQRCAEMEFDDGARRKRLIVTINYTRRGGCSGYAFYDSNRSTVRIAPPKLVDMQNVDRLNHLKKQFAHVACHEFAHNRGMTHRQMPNFYRWHGRWEERVQWAATMPLTVQQPKPKATKAAVIDSKLAHVTKMVKLAETRRRRAQTIERKWRRRLAYYTKQQAAMQPAAPVTE